MATINELSATLRSMARRLGTERRAWATAMEVSGKRWADLYDRDLDRLRATERRIHELIEAGEAGNVIDCLACGSFGVKGKACQDCGRPPGSDGCMACIVGVATGPGSHAPDCEARAIPMPEQDGQWGPEWDDYDRKVAEAKGRRHD